MSEQARPQDFEEVVRRIGADAIRQLGGESAAITAEAAAKGALSNSRIVFLYANALDRCWRAAADQIMAELRRWTKDTTIGRRPLRGVAEGELRRLLPALIEASRVRRAATGFSNQTMLQPAQDRIAALEEDITYRLRQFDINMDVSSSDALPRWRLPTWRTALRWAGEHVAQVLVGVVILAVAAALGLS